MSWKCAICGKKPSVGYRVSHSTKHTKHVWKPNLQPARIMINGKVKKVRVCAGCIKSDKVTKV